MKYHLARGQEQLGTFTDLEISSGMREGSLKPTDLCWTEGMAEWQSLETRLKGLAKDVGEEYVAVDVPPTIPQVAALREEVRKDHERPAVELASRSSRLLAKLVDLAMFIIPSIIFWTTLMEKPLESIMMDAQTNPEAFLKAMQAQMQKMQDSGNLTVSLMSGLMNILMVTNVVLLTVRGQTLGKLLLRVQIVRAPDGARAGFVRAVLLRAVLFPVMSFLMYLHPLAQMLLLLDVLLIFRQDRRCLHDLVADTRVIRRR